MRNMTKIAALIFVVCGLHIMVAHANPPNAMFVNYDLKRQELGVKIQHPVGNRLKHFIKMVIVYKNGKEVAKKEFDFQTSNRNQTMPPFKIPAFKGNTFKVVATCNTTGQGEKTITVE